MMPRDPAMPHVRPASGPRRACPPIGYAFSLAGPADCEDLQRFSRASEMPGAIRIALERTPDYFDALRVEGRLSEVLTCREAGSGRLVGTGHRSIKPALVDGEIMPVGYLGGLRLAPSARSARLLARGYAHLRKLQVGNPARLHLTTIMEDNAPAGRVLLSHRLGLPAYHDLGRFCSIAAGLHGDGNRSHGLDLRPATAMDGNRVVAFLRQHGGTKQFFPDYAVSDFGRPGRLLHHLDWSDVLLASSGSELVGVLAAWDQRDFRRWRVCGYAPWLRALRWPVNLSALLRRRPTLPAPGSPLECFVLSLVCVRDNDRGVFRALLGEVIRARRNRFSFFLAGLHERDPLLPELLRLPHVPLHSRLFAVAWDDGVAAIQALDRTRVPYLEMGSL